MSHRLPPEIVTLPPELAFYVSPPHPCSYLDDRDSVTLFADPNAEIDSAIYSDLAELGFRRSGSHIYRPRCPHCDACIPVRIPVNEFMPDRSQRRSWNKNRDLAITIQNAEFRDEHYQLYRRYMASRHSGGSMDVDSEEQYIDFLTSPWCKTHFVEYRLNGELLAVAVMDLLRSGLSAVYTFFDPHHGQRGLGNLVVLWMVEEAKRRGLSWVYLGYLINESPKMAYKARYSPLQEFHHGYWHIK